MRQKIWKKQDGALRNPSEIFGAPFKLSGIEKKSLEFKSSENFARLIKRLNITLIISREYENFLLALSCEKNQIKQSFFHVPHPSGIAVDKKNKNIFVASTRNPNQIIQFAPFEKDGKKILMPVKSKYYPGKYYFHELAFVGKELFGNAVGMNSIVKIDINSNTHEKPLWWPKCVDGKNKKPLSDSNFIQLNSIAAGNSIKNSFFSASNDKITKLRPGNPKYEVDGKGVVFDGKTGKVYGKGLTRPHSTRLYKGTVVVNNSGYGEFGAIIGGKFEPFAKLPGWTRGLYIIKDIAFVGVSRILPRFKSYAPGVNGKKQECAIYAFDLKKKKIIGKIEFPWGNQIFAIESLPNSIKGFVYKNIPTNKKEISEEKEIFFNYK